MSKSLKDYIIHYEGILPKEFCEELIQTYDSIQSDDPLKVNRKNDFMNFTEVNMLDHHAFKNLSEQFIERMVAINHLYFDQTCKNLKQRFQCYQSFADYEAPRIKRYEPGTGVFDWHIDNADISSMRRALVMFWYLNDVEKGGETVFDMGDDETISIQPTQGSVACFPPFWNFPHRGNTPESGPKYVISSYVCLPEEYGQSCD